MAAADELISGLETYVAADRRAALQRGEWLPDREHGTVLFADIGGFTGLAERMERAYGPYRGAEELAVAVHRVFDALTEAVDRRHGSIVAFAGDAMTCWFAGEGAAPAVAAAFDMRAAMERAGAVEIPGEPAGALSLKVAVASGEVRRLVAGDPDAHLLDVIAGDVVDRSGEGEKHCAPGEIVIDRATAHRLGARIARGATREGFHVVEALHERPEPAPWPDRGAVAGETLRPWMLASIYDRVRAGRARFLAEFRPVAILFVSFGGIDYGAADAQDVLDRFVRRTQSIVQAQGGAVFDISTGDKGSYLLAVFGAPVAHGDDVRRAVAAAAGLREGAERELRIGVHAGRVFAGLYPGRHRSAYSVLGDTVNTAARLMQRAGPGQILMSGRVGEALDRRFAVRALEPITVRGRSAPVAVCELVGTAEPDQALTEPRYPLPIVGRERELELIERALVEAAAGQGGVLAVIAEAGLGKSRLVNAAIRRATDAGFATFAGECQPTGAGMAYLPWRSIWHGLLGVPADADDAARQQALHAALAAASPDAPALAPLLSPVLDLALPETDATRSMPGPIRKQVLEQLLVGALRGRAGGGPVCVVLEDLHWADSLSRDLLGRLAEGIADVPVILVIAVRPGEDGPVAASDPGIPPARWTIELGELSEADARGLAGMLLGQATGQQPEPAAIDAIVARANGNPFYLEELVREVMARGESGESGDADLPTSLESLILGRIDRLSESQQLTARVASVIGRRFASEWLTGAYANTLEGSRVGADLRELGGSGLIVADTPAPQEAWLFRHVIVRDVAYGTLGFRLRQTLHEQLAAHLERALESPSVELLVYHYAHSANAAKEASYRRRAAELAIHNGAYGDAVAHVRRAEEIVAGQPSGAERLEQELELALLHGSILLVTDGQGSRRAKAMYDRARELSRDLPPGPALGRATFGLWTYYLFQGLMGPTAELAEEALALTARSPDPGVRIMAHLAASQTHMWTGQWARCVEHFDRVMELYDPSDHEAYITQYAQNPRFTASNSAFWGEWMRGRSQSAGAIAEQAIAEARELHHEFTYTIAFAGRPLLAMFRRDQAALAASVGEYVTSARRSGNPFYVALALSFEATVRILEGDAAGGLSQLQAQYQAMQELGSKLVDPLIVAMLAEGHLLAGRHAEGLALLDESLPAFERDGRASMLPWHLRLRAELLLRADPAAHGSALDLLEQAMAVAHRHGALALELRAALSAARVLGALDRGAEGRALVAGIYGRFTEGFEDPDLRDARTLLAADAPGPTPTRGHR